MSMEGEKVELNIYDLSQGLALTMSSSLLGKVIDGIWHTGVVVYGTEYYFGGGIQAVPRGHTPYGKPLRVVQLGYTQVPKDIFEEYLREITPRFTQETYNILHHNCNNFSEEISQFLVGSSIPEYILSLPAEIMNSPMGSMLMPIIMQLDNTLKHNGVPQQFGPQGVQARNPPANSAPFSTVGPSLPRARVDTASNAQLNAVPDTQKGAGNDGCKGKEVESKDPLAKARAEAQEEITKEFMGLMASGGLGPCEAAVLATRRVRERHGIGSVARSQS